MRTDNIQTLVANTFSKLACPANGHGMYAEIEKAILEAYNLGKANQESHHAIKPNEEFMYAFQRA